MHVHLFSEEKQKSDTSLLPLGFPFVSSTQASALETVALNSVLQNDVLVLKKNNQTKKAV